MILNKCFYWVLPFATITTTFCTDILYKSQFSSLGEEDIVVRCGLELVFLLYYLYVEIFRKKKYNLRNLQQKSRVVACVEMIFEK
jgi:hypothetical protein